jgi:excisionase family DNA binding protein
MPRSERLSPEEIDLAFRDEKVRAQFPPILTPPQCAAMLSVSVSTLYLWIADGRLKGAVTKIGKHRRIFRNRAIEILFNHNKAKETADADDEDDSR